MYTTILTNLENGIFTITINRPDKLNALNKDVFTDLDKAIDELTANAGIKSAIITGAGPKAFVAGADIKFFVRNIKAGKINNIETFTAFLARMCSAVLTVLRKK